MYMLLVIVTLGMIFILVRARVFRSIYKLAAHSKLQPKVRIYIYDS